jgi:hypothetical protein
MQFRIACIPVGCLKGIKIKIYKTIMLTVVLYVCETFASHVERRTQIEGV